MKYVFNAVELKLKANKANSRALLFCFLSSFLWKNTYLILNRQIGYDVFNLLFSLLHCAVSLC